MPKNQSLESDGALKVAGDEGTSYEDRSAESRREILNAARQLFAEKGYSATSIADIVERAGKSIGLPYYHFGSKKQIFLTIWNEYQQSQEDYAAAAVAKARRSGASGKDLFLAGARAYLERAWMARDYEPMVILSTDTPPEFDAVLAEAARRWGRQNRSLLSEYDSRLVKTATVMASGALRSLCLEFPKCKGDAEANRLIDDAEGLLSTMLRIL
jgi:AcrR family transcriptional regulator